MSIREPMEPDALTARSSRAGVHARGAFNDPWQAVHCTAGFAAWRTTKLSTEPSTTATTCRSPPGSPRAASGRLQPRRAELQQARARRGLKGGIRALSQDEASAKKRRSLSKLIPWITAVAALGGLAVGIVNLLP